MQEIMVGYFFISNNITIFVQFGLNKQLDMITRERITSEQDTLFQFCWTLYMMSFPENERRAKEYQEETMKRELYHFDVVLDSGELIGFIGWWDFDDVRFIEHFATSASLRGQGYGAQILRSFAAESTKPIILEVEHPTYELARRRIGFYERLGFVLNPYGYEHPSYQQLDGQTVSLMIMSYPEPISEQQLVDFKDRYIETIHFKNFE